MTQQVPRYTTIIHTIRISLDLTTNEYCVADIIYHLSNNPSSLIQGWCWASKETIAGYLGISKQSVLNMLKRLLDKRLIEKDPDTKYLRTTATWYEKVVLEKIKFNGKESLPSSQKFDSFRSRKFTENGKETLPYNNKYNKNDNYRDNSPQKGKTGGQVQTVGEVLQDFSFKKE